MSATPSAADDKPIRESLSETGLTRFEVCPSGASIAGVVYISAMVIAAVIAKKSKQIKKSKSKMEIKKQPSTGANLQKNESLGIVNNRDNSDRRH